MLRSPGCERWVWEALSWSVGFAFFGKRGKRFSGAKDGMRVPRCWKRLLRQEWVGVSHIIISQYNSIIKVIWT